ncbi:MAG TPA: sugar transferase [Bacteroidales bacterium]|nr:sugar transferase [Bacteroidales bacterium]
MGLKGYLTFKRIFDVVSAAAGLILFFPFFAVAAVMIKLDSPGPVFYRGIRSGKNSQPFRIYKFRTMYVGREKPAGDTTALNDPRITRVGAVLRKYKFDEFPQLINVLNGEMSMVGPRPELPAYTNRYTVKEKLILSIRPGITDLSSIEFSSLDEQVGAQDPDRVYEERILPIKNSMRLEYVKNMSFRTDMKLILLTFKAILRKAFLNNRSCA